MINLNIPPSKLLLCYRVVRKLHFGNVGKKLFYWLNCKFNRPSAGIENKKDYLESVHKDVGSHSLCNNEIVTPSCDCQIIMPVYNTGKFLRESIDSVLSQVTKYTYHLVIVNDGSTDCSAEILADYASDSRVTIINQENKGVSDARNTALKTLFGRYITFLDSDDIMAPDAITNLLDAAYKYDADVVEGSYRRRKPDGRLFDGVKYDKESVVRKPNIQMRGVPWAKVYKAELWGNIKFPESYWYEDTIICGLILPLVTKYVQITDDVVYYTVNTESITFISNGKPKMLDNLYVTKSVLADAESIGLIKDNYEQYYRFFLYQTHINWDRTYLLGPDIEYLVFRETCALFDKYLPKDIETQGCYATMATALREHNYKLYRHSNIMGF